MTAAKPVPYVESALDFCWTLWTQLGVRGWDARNFDAAVDVEPLVLFTSELSHHDLRLRDEAISWCVERGRYLSGVRIRNLLRISDESVVNAFADFASIVNANSMLNLPGASGRRIGYEVRLRHERPNFSAPAAVGLRLRGMLGVGPRAELLKLFLAYPSEALSAPEASLHVFHARRNVADALESLEAALILSSVSDRNSRRFIPRDLTPIAKLLGPVPHRFPFWPDVFDVVLRLMRVLVKAADETPLVRVVNAQRFLTAHALILARNYFVPPPAIGPGKESWSHFEEWSMRFIESLKSPESPLLMTPPVRAITAMPLYARGKKKLTKRAV